MIGDRPSEEAVVEVAPTVNEEVQVAPASSSSGVDETKQLRKFSAADASAQLQEAIKSTQPVTPFDPSSSLSALLQVLQSSSTAQVGGVLSNATPSSPPAAATGVNSEDNLFIMDTKADSDNPFTSNKHEDLGQETNGAELICYQCPMRFPCVFSSIACKY